MSRQTGAMENRFFAQQPQQPRPSTRSLKLEELEKALKSIAWSQETWHDDSKTLQNIWDACGHWVNKHLMERSANIELYRNPQLEKEMEYGLEFISSITTIIKSPLQEVMGYGIANKVGIIRDMILNWEPTLPQTSQSFANGM